MPKNICWEHGSEFHWPWIGDYSIDVHLSPWKSDAVFAGSGRDALRLLLSFGRKKLGWTRVLLPSYLCQEVANAILADGFEIKVFFDDPRKQINPPEPQQNDVLLIVNTFGVRERTKPGMASSGTIIEDHTHDPWSDWARTSHADYCIASLRKTLPIPDGGVVWSPLGKPLPSSPVLTESHHVSASLKVEAMILKTFYLKNFYSSKKAFRELADAGEKLISSGKVSAISLISAAIINCFPARIWRARRLENFNRLTIQLKEINCIEVIHPRDPGSCPFSIVLLMQDTESRDGLKEFLIENNVFPAILWPFEHPAVILPKSTLELSRNILSLHCDGRYESADMDKVAKLVHRYMECKI